MKRLLQWLGAMLVGLLVLVAGLLLWYRQASLPVHEGAQRVTGIGTEVRIERDAQGIPRIVAGSEADALFGLGYVHAQDRLWQMDFNRRVAQGRLAELVGPAGLDTDRFLRTLGIQRHAQALLDAADADTRALVDAYVAGVNAALAARSGPLPPEFLLTRAPAPAPWTARDTAGWAMLMALDLSQEWRDELARLRLAARFTLEEINDLRPPPGDDAVVPTADYPAQYRLMGLFAAPRDDAKRSALLDDAERLAALPSFAGFGVGEGIGSNNWVLAGSRSASGAPLLANDPHLSLTTPSIWYLARLQAPGLTVSGATLPGLPWVLLGRNADVAWGATSVHGDGSDLYVERLNPADPGQYQTPDGFAAFEQHVETIKVRGGEDVQFTVRRTRHGPVLSGVLGPVDRMLDSGRHVLALRWGAAEPQDRTLAAVRAMNRARNADELQRAITGWTLTQQYMVFADGAGTIGMQVTGRYPRRSADNAFAGVAPAPGWDRRNDWQGLVPPAELPRIVDPTSGAIATANNNAMPAGYPQRLGHDFAPPYRAQRIEQLLAARDKHDLASMRSIQTDTRSLAAHALLAALADTRPASAAGKLALARLLAWDGTMSADAAEPLLLHAWLRKLRIAVFADDLGDLAPQTVERSEMTQALVNVLTGKARARRWCDRQSSPRVETCAELAAEALDAAVTELAETTGRDPLGLRWADVHVARLDHRPLSNVPVLRSLFEHRVAVGGDTHSPAVAALSPDPKAPFASGHGAGVRMVFDLAPALGVDGGAWVLSTGQSGHPASDHLSDQLVTWQRGGYLPLKPDMRGARTLLLQPARKP